MADKIAETLQESILTTLIFDERYGAAIAAQVAVDHFDGPYRSIAERVLNYRNEYGRAPGRSHLDNLFEDVLAKQDDDRQSARLVRIIGNLVAQSKGLNARFAAERTSAFIRRQLLTDGIIRASEIVGRGGEDVVQEAERVLYDALTKSPREMDAGVSLSNIRRGLNFLERTGQSLPLGIPEFDRIGAGPMPRELLLYIAPKGSGKSWFCVHVGKRGLMHGERVLHVTLENSEEVTAGRYYQALFSLARRAGNVRAFDFKLEKGRIVALESKFLKPAFTYDETKARAKLRDEIKKWGPRLDRVRIKEFATGDLTMSMLNSYLDWLERSEGFIPTILIVDYPDLMKQDPNNLRHTLGATFVGLRGLAVKRNLAVVCPTQGNRASIEAKEVKSGHSSEAIGKVHTADTVYTYSATELEKNMGLARLRLNHARDSESDIVVLLSQSYAIGQYVLKTARMQSSYWELIKQDPDEAEAEELLSDT